jgi:hypothetical protein
MSSASHAPLQTICIQWITFFDQYLSLLSLQQAVQSVLQHEQMAWHAESAPASVPVIQKYNTHACIYTAGCELRW